MRRASIGLLLAAALLLWAPSAWAFRDAESEGRLSGDIVLTWHGDPARGCAAAGLCDVSGSLRYAPDTAFTYGDLAANGRFEPDELDLESGDPTTVRVRRGASSGASGLCLDVEDTSFELSLRRGSGGHYRVGLFGDDREAGGFSSGRCAGPLAQDLATLFPIGTLDTSGLARHSALLDLSGRLPFVAGPFSGELNSTLRARMPRLEVDEESSSSGSASNSVTAEHKERRLNLLIDYRVRSGSGSLAGSFGGTAEPFCLPFDACGVRASLSYAASFAPQSGSVTIYAHRTLGRHEHANLRTALRDLRENRLELEPFVDPPEGAQGRADSSVSLPDGVTCTDRGVSTSVDIGVDRVARGIRFGLNPAADGGTDALRTHCQGPGQQDIAGAGPLLAATTSYRDVARKSLHLHLRPRASFATSAYSGTLTGSFEMDLTRTALRASVQTAYVSP